MDPRQAERAAIEHAVRAGYVDAAHVEEARRRWEQARQADPALGLLQVLTPTLPPAVLPELRQVYQQALSGSASGRERRPSGSNPRPASPPRPAPQPTPIPAVAQGPTSPPAAAQRPTSPPAAVQRPTRPPVAPQGPTRPPAVAQSPTSPPAAADAVLLSRLALGVTILASAAAAALLTSVGWWLAGAGDAAGAPTAAITLSDDQVMARVRAALAFDPQASPPPEHVLLTRVLQVRGRHEVETLRALVAQPGPTRAAAILLLGALEDADAEPLLRPLAESTDELTRLLARDALARLEGRHAEADLLKALGSGDPAVRDLALRTLGDARLEAGLSPLLELAQDVEQTSTTRSLAARAALAIDPGALARLAPRPAPPPVARPTPRPRTPALVVEPSPSPRASPSAPPSPAPSPSPTAVAAVSPAPASSPPAANPAPTPNPTPAAGAEPEDDAEDDAGDDAGGGRAPLRARVDSLLDRGRWKHALTVIERNIERIQQPAARGSLLRQRGRAQLELGRIEEAQADLRQAIELDPDQAQAYFDLAALFAGDDDKSKAYGALGMALRLGFDDLPALRAEARLEDLRGSQAFKALMERFFHFHLVAEPDPERRFKEAAKRLKAAFRKQRDPYLRAQAALRFTEAGSPDATELLLDLLDDRDEVVRRALAEVLGGTREPAAVELLCARLGAQPKARLGQALVWALRDVPGAPATDALLAGLDHKADAVWQAAAQALGDRPDARAIPPLLTHLEAAADEPRVAALVTEALGKITGQDLPPVAQDWQNWFAAHGASLEVGPVHDPCTPQLGRTVVVPAGFRDRQAGKARTRALKRWGGSAATERTVSQALDWLARHQDEDGRWNTDEWALRCGEREAWEKVTKVRERRWDVHVTGLALMAFLGAGHSHLTGDHQDTVRKGLDWLRKQQRADGYFQGDQHHHHFSQACATTALVEAYLLTRDCQLKPAAERGLAFVVDRQYPSGGWGWNKDESRVQPSVWNLMAINTAHLAGLRVPASSQVWVRDFLDRVTLSEPDGQLKPGFTRNLLAPDTRVGEGLSVEDHGEVATGGNHVTTAMGVWVRLVLGQDVDDPRVAGGLAQVAGRAPKADAEGQLPASEWLFFSAQALILGGSKAWPNWNDALIDGLLAGVASEGCERGTWEPTGDRGRVHAVALGALTLESYYRFNLSSSE